MSLRVRIVSSLLLVLCPLTPADKQPFQVRSTFCGPNLRAAVKLACASYNGNFVDSSADYKQPTIDKPSSEEDFEESNVVEPSSGTGVVDECCNRPCTLIDMQKYCNRRRNLQNLTDDEIQALNNLIKSSDPAQQFGDPFAASGRDVSSQNDDEIRDMTILYVDLECDPMVTILSHSSPESAAYLYDPVDVLPFN